MKTFYSKAQITGLLFLFSISFYSLHAQELNKAQVFGGRGQYRTWSVSPYIGLLRPSTLIGSSPDYNLPQNSLGYGLGIRKQLGHAFGLEADFLKGNIQADNDNSSGQSTNNNESFDTNLGWTASLLGVVNVATVDFIRKENKVNFLVKAGYGRMAYSTSYIDEHVQEFDGKGTYGPDGNDTYKKAKMFPIGLGAKFNISNRLMLDLGYNMNLLNVDDIDEYSNKGNDSFSFLYGSLGISLGKASKPNLDWVNPLALMYDELKDPEIRKELAELKSRINTLESADLLKDTDGDGVADKLDKCPGTEAGIRVDGSGCPLDADGDGIPDSNDSCPTEKGTAELNGCPGSNNLAAGIHFEFNSAVLRTQDYAYLDQLVITFNDDNVNSVILEGHASDEGTPAYNMQLSKDRANSVKTYLVNSGVAANKITTKGFGETRPVASNETEEGRQQNRRVEIVRQ